MKEIFTQNLPKAGNRISWKESKGYEVDFIFGEIKGKIKIIDYEQNKKHCLTVEYNNRSYEILTDNFKNCKISRILKIKTKDFKYNIGDFIEHTNMKIIDCEVRERPNNATGSYKYYLIECQECKSIKWILEENITRRHGTSCNACGDGIKYPEKFMMEMLSQLNIVYEFQYSPDWIVPRKYDFYIPVMN
jgi:hypothetical protein